MKEKVVLEDGRDYCFNSKIKKLESNKLISKNYIHVLKSLYDYMKQIERQLDEMLFDTEEKEEEAFYLIELQTKIENELNKFKLLSSEGKVKRKSSRHNKRID